MNEVIDMNAVEKNYGPVPVIQNCSFRIPEGEFYRLLGVNGAGKTTLIKLIPGLQRADRGSIHVPGQEAGACTGYLGEAGSVIEHPAFYKHLTGVLLLMAAVFLSITGLILRIMADHVKQMEV